MHTTYVLNIDLIKSFKVVLKLKAGFKKVLKGFLLKITIK